MYAINNLKKKLQLYNSDQLKFIVSNTFFMMKIVFGTISVPRLLNLGVV